MPHPTNSPMSRGTRPLVPGKTVEGGENKRLLNHAYYYYDSFYLGVISAGCRSILSDRECSAGAATRPFALKVKRSTLEGNNGTVDEDHRLSSSRNGPPLRGCGLAVSGSGESL